MKKLLTCAFLVACVAAGPMKWFELQKSSAIQMTQDVLENAESLIKDVKDATPLAKESLNEMPKLWEEFKQKFRKLYNNVEEEARRLGIFVKNMAHIVAHNQLNDKGQKSYRLGLNEYADMEHSEFVRIMNGFRQNKTAPRHPLASTYLSPSNLKELPVSKDWRDNGYVTDVKNQGQCGSCWSFSATGSLEGQHFRQTGNLVSLSEQNLVDCSGKWGNQGCEGGLMDQAFQYVKDNKGIDTENAYPYTAKEDPCEFNKSTIGATDSGFVDLPSADESKLQEALATIGPISVAIDAGHHSFQLYKSGVYDEPECSSTELDHGVLAVGYGIDSDSRADFWLVKNSWGTSWGEDGYIKMVRNKNNQCGVASQASYPLV